MRIETVGSIASGRAISLAEQHTPFLSPSHIVDSITKSTPALSQKRRWNNLFLAAAGHRYRMASKAIGLILPFAGSREPVRFQGRKIGTERFPYIFKDARQISKDRHGQTDQWETLHSQRPQDSTKHVVWLHPSRIAPQFMLKSKRRKRIGRKV